MNKHSRDIAISFFMMALVILGAGIAIVSAKELSADMSADVAAVSNISPKIWTVGVGGQMGNMAIQGMGFYPGKITIDEGDTIEWKLNGNYHTISFVSSMILPVPGSKESLAPSGGSEYDGTGFVSSGILQKGDNYSLKFTKAGIYGYHCLVHPGMHGLVIVQPEGTKVPFSQAVYDKWGALALERDFAVAQALIPEVKVNKSSGPDNTTMWEAFIDIPIQEKVIVTIKPTKLPEPMAMPNLKGIAVLNMASAGELSVDLNVSGLEPNSSMPANIQMGTCNKPSDVIFALGNIGVDSEGKLSVDTTVSSPAIENRGWIVSIGDEMQPVGCGNVVKYSAAYLRYTPKNTLTITQGDTVTWTQLNPMEVHTVSFLAEGQVEPEKLLPDFTINPEITTPVGEAEYDGTGFHNSGILMAGDKYSLTFTQPGTFKYQCLLHDELGMIGWVKVKPKQGTI